MEGAFAPNLNLEVSQYAFFGKWRCSLLVCDFLLAGGNPLPVHHHEGLVVAATLGARAWVHVLEPFQFELVADGLHSNLLTHGVVCVDLGIRHSHTCRGFRHRSLYQHGC